MQLRAANGIRNQPSVIDIISTPDIAVGTCLGTESPGMFKLCLERRALSPSHIDQQGHDAGQCWTSVVIPVWHYLHSI